ncbi:MAG: hypothetical protein QOD40_1983 [Alphaproteobacteria bacterium]|jgi:hypothetical protein|nr:hypothetical protein [Alphaproteobacteria bacterium]
MTKTASLESLFFAAGIALAVQQPCAAAQLSVKFGAINMCEDSTSQAGGVRATENEKKKTTKQERDLVITPAGPMRRENVHKVGPDQAVERNPDGTMTIVPRKPK